MRLGATNFLCSVYANDQDVLIQYNNNCETNFIWLGMLEADSFLNASYQRQLNLKMQF